MVSTASRSLPLAPHLGLSLHLDCPGDLAAFRHFAWCFAVVHDHLPERARAALWLRWERERPCIRIVPHLDYFDRPVVWGLYEHRSNRFSFAWDRVAPLLSADLLVGCVVAHELGHAVFCNLSLPDDEAAVDRLATSWGFFSMAEFRRRAGARG